MAINLSKQIGFVKLNPRAKHPIRGSRQAAGFDLYSTDHFYIRSGDRSLVNTGLSFMMPVGTYARLATRSSYAVRGIDVGAGVIDPDYTGEVKVLIINNSNEDLQIKEGDRFAQVIFEFYHTGKMIEITDLNAVVQTDEESILVVRKEPNTRLPEKYTEDSVSFDFIADAAFLLQPKSRKNIRTGVKFIFSSNAYGYVSGKVDLALQGVDCIETIINAEPNDDEVSIILHNRSNMPIFIERGEKIAKIIFVKNAAQVNATSILEEALKGERGSLGFGSTGNR